MYGATLNVKANPVLLPRMASRIFTTEITSAQLASDNPIHQRLLRAYVLAQPLVKGHVLEVGCGEGRGIDYLLPACKHYTAVDKIGQALARLRQKYPHATFIEENIPPLSVFADNSFDTVLSFQVIEHIENDSLFLSEIARVLKPGALALISTPNRAMSLSRNPWHVREYTAAELEALARKYFAYVEMKGIAGNDTVMRYYERNRAAVQKIMRWDIFDLQHRLPARFLQVPYELLNRFNRNSLKNSADELVASIRHEDYVLVDDAEQALDLYLMIKK